MVTYIDGYKDRFGVEPICAVLPIAPSTYYAHKAKHRDPERRSTRVKQDDVLKPEIQRVWEENFRVYGVRKVWRQLNREGIEVPRCTVERLMRDLGLRGVVRGRRMKTTVPSELLDRPMDRVNREFRASRPNALWVADLTFVATWRRSPPRQEDSSKLEVPAVSNRRRNWAGGIRPRLRWGRSSLYRRHQSSVISRT